MAGSSLSSSISLSVCMIMITPMLLFNFFQSFSVFFSLLMLEFLCFRNLLLCHLWL